jgi:hypothetical protein
MVAGVNRAESALTMPACLAKKLTQWGKLRQCQAVQNGKALQGKLADPGKCQTKFDGELAAISAKATAAAVACRYGVNGDGTVTDYNTGLVWEQKDNLDGTPNPADPHDADNTYHWSASGTPDGGAFTGFLASLNDCESSDGTTLTGGFAGHCDWRLPSVVELAGIVDLSAPGCGTGSPCIDQTVFGPTVLGFYWSATTIATVPTFALVVGSTDGLVNGVSKDSSVHVRGVRSGL